MKKALRIIWLIIKKLLSFLAFLIRKIGLILQILIVLFFILVLRGCTIETRYKFVHEESQISQIEIINFTTLTDLDQSEPEEFYLIDDKDQFIKDFRTVRCTKSLIGDPQLMESYAYIFRITYENGDRELIGRNGSYFYTQEEPFWREGPFKYLDDEEYDELMKKYLPEDVLEKFEESKKYIKW